VGELGSWVKTRSHFSNFESRPRYLSRLENGTTEYGKIMKYRLLTKLRLLQSPV